MTRFRVLKIFVGCLRKSVFCFVHKGAHWRLSNALLCTCPLKRFDLDIFRVLLRRLRLPLPLSSHSCRCGRPLDCLAITVVWFHFGVCSCIGVPRSRSESLDTHCIWILWRIEVVTEGLPIFHGASVAMDSNLVSPTVPGHGCVGRRNSRTYPEFTKL